MSAALACFCRCRRWASSLLLLGVWLALVLGRLGHTDRASGCWVHRRQSSIGVTILACSSAFASFIFEKPRSQHTVCREVVFAATVPVTTTSASAFAGAGFGFGGADSGTEGEGEGLELNGGVGRCGARGGSGGGTDVMGLANPSFVPPGAVSPARKVALANFTGAFSNNTFRTTEDI